MQRGEIYLLDMQSHTGNQLSGKRPVMILQNNIGNFYSPTTIVCGISTKIFKQLPTHILLPVGGGLRKTSIACLEQIFTVNKSDLERYIARITDPKILQRIDKGLKISLGIEDESTCTIQ